MARGSRGSGKWAGYGGGYTPAASGGGGSTPAWVPANAMIHVDLVGGTPQGRAWMRGTGVVAVDTLLGSDANTEEGWGDISSYDPGALEPEGYPNTAGVFALIGAARTKLFEGCTIRCQFRAAAVFGDLFDHTFAAISADGSAGIEVRLELPVERAVIESWAGALYEIISDCLNFDEEVEVTNAFALTLTPTRAELAVNGSGIAEGAPTEDEYPTSGPSQLVAALIEVHRAGWCQSITLYDPLPSTAGLSDLSEVT